MKARRLKRTTKTALFTFSVIVSLLITYQSLINLIIYDPSQMTEKPIVKTTKKLSDFPKTEKLYSFQGHKLVHIDLKGAPPRVSYLEQFFPYIREMGATGVFIEYEDMFPYTDELENLTAKNSYSLKDLRTVLKSAEDSNLMVVPSIQVLGHLEFVLKLKEFKDLREIRYYPETLCPTNPKAFALVRKMIDQVLKAHSGAKYIHIGCDEVQYIGNCNRCKGVMSEKKWIPPDLYLSYVRKVAVYISETYPGVRPIVWGNIISKISKLILLRSEIHTVVDLMIFIYSPNVTNYLTDRMLTLYSKVFKSIWIASAFKGVTGPNRMVAEVNFHLQNHISWMDVVAKWQKLINFKGILLTGRQRYNHFAELCELLPAAIPSLTENLLYLRQTDSIMNNVTETSLQCEQVLFPSYDYSLTPRCNFPGIMIYALVSKFETFYKAMKKCLSLTEDGQFTIYNILRQFISPFTVKYIFEKLRVEENLDELISMEEELRDNLLEVYDHNTAEEWVKTYMTPARIKLEALLQVKEILEKMDTWPRRPFDDTDHVLAKKTKKICASDRKLDCILLFI